MKKAIGISMLLAVFVGLFIFCWILNGFLITAGMFLGLAVLLWWIKMAFDFLSD